MRRTRVGLLLGLAILIPAIGSAEQLKGAHPSTNLAEPVQGALSALNCVGGMAGPYPCKNIDLQAFVPLATMQCGSGNSLWGWTDPQTGKEYALMGCDNGISFVDISVPTAPVYLGRLPTHEDALDDGHEHEHAGVVAQKHEGNSLWRDVRVYKNHAFVGSEQAHHHIQVFDLTQLRNVPSPPVEFAETALYADHGIETTHTVAINEATGFVYAAGTNTCSGGLHMIDATDPKHPTFAGCVDQDGYTHETQCVTYAGPDADYTGRELCFSSNVDTLTIVDVTDKSNPVQISRTGYSTAAYTHQGWLTPGDQRYFLMNDELENLNWTYIWDLADLDAPVLMGHHVGATTAIDHNLYIKGPYAYESQYRAGLRIVDVTGVASASLSEVAFFDIYPSDDAAEFNANWNNYPFFGSGNVIISGIEQGLYILKPNLDPNPTSIGVGDLTIAEGETTLNFDVHLSVAVPRTVTVEYETQAITASSGVDFDGAAGTLTFDPGLTHRTVTIPVHGDALDEGDETFRLTLSNATGANLADSAATGTILDDDPMPSLAVSDVTVTEGESGYAPASFTVTLSAASGREVSVILSTSNGTAWAGNDYTSRTAAVALAAGETQKIVDVQVRGDDRDEEDEFFLVKLASPVNASLADTQGTGTILDDDTLGVHAIEPPSGPASGGTAVTISGESFELGATAQIGGLAAGGPVVVGTTGIDASAPALEAGAAYDVVVTNPGGGSATLPSAYLSDFLDVAAAHPFHDFVVETALAGITAGCGGGNYCPNLSVTRAQMAVFLLKAKNGAAYAPPPATGTVFGDVPAGSFAAAWIEALAALGVTGGCGNGNYCPGTLVTRAQMAVFLLKAAEGSGYAPPPAVGVFADVPVGAFADAWIEELHARGVTGGCATSPLRYCPTGANTRGQMAVFVVKAFGL